MKTSTNLAVDLGALRSLSRTFDPSRGELESHVARSLKEDRNLFFAAQKLFGLLITLGEARSDQEVLWDVVGFRSVFSVSHFLWRRPLPMWSVACTEIRRAAQRSNLRVWKNSEQSCWRCEEWLLWRTTLVPHYNRGSSQGVFSHLYALDCNYFWSLRVSMP